MTTKTGPILQILTIHLMGVIMVVHPPQVSPLWGKCLGERRKQWAIDQILKKGVDPSVDPINDSRHFLTFSTFCTTNCRHAALAVKERCCTPVAVKPHWLQKMQHWMQRCGTGYSSSPGCWYVAIAAEIRLALAAISHKYSTGCNIDCKDVVLRATVMHRLLQRYTTGCKQEHEAATANAALAAKMWHWLQ